MVATVPEYLEQAHNVVEDLLRYYNDHMNGIECIPCRAIVMGAACAIMLKAMNSEIVKHGGAEHAQRWNTVIAAVQGALIETLPAANDTAGSVKTLTLAEMLARLEENLGLSKKKESDKTTKH